MDAHEAEQIPVVEIRKSSELGGCCVIVLVLLLTCCVLLSNLLKKERVCFCHFSCLSSIPFSEVTENSFTKDY